MNSSNIGKHGMTSLSFRTAAQKNEAKLTSFVLYENEMESYCALQLNKARLEQ